MNTKEKVCLVLEGMKNGKAMSGLYASKGKEPIGRVFYPLVIGEKENEKTYLLAHQISGGSREGFALYEIEKLNNLSITEQSIPESFYKEQVEEKKWTKILETISKRQ
jgi:hypothetical protein